MSGTSSVGQASVYEAGDQRNPPRSELNNANRFHEGKENSHQANDPRDERSIANRLAHESNKKSGNEDSFETKLLKKDPTLPAKMQGHEPSRGARIDAEIQAEEEEELMKKKYRN